jgi:MscS family membrane protein
VLSLVWAVYRLVDVLAETMAAKAAVTESKLDDQLVPLVRKSLKVLTVIAGLLFLLENLNVDVTSLLAGLGIGGVAVALAAKDTVANFFGSIMIFIDRPFQIGDWVVVSGVEGIVEEVGFRSTRIRTFYNSLVTVPNAKFMEANIDNYGARQYRRSYFTLNVTYDTTVDQMQSFVEGIRAIIQNNPYTRKDYYEVHMSGFGAHSLDVMVYFFFKVKSWTEELRERHHVLLEIMRLAADLGIVFAFPTQTLQVDSLAAPGAERQLPPPLPRGELESVIRDFGPGGTKGQPGGHLVTHGYFANLPTARGPSPDDDEDAGSAGRS